MITYPLSPSFKEIEITSDDPTITFRAQNGRRISRKVSGQIWKLKLTYPPMKRQVFAPVLGAIARARGAFDTFQIIPPNLKNPLGSQTANVTAAATGVGVTAIPISGATALATFVAGDVVVFDNHTKVYMIVEDTAADGTGAATVIITPPLVEAILATTEMKLTNVPFTVSMVGDAQEFKTNVSGYIKYELDVEESF